MLSPVMPVYFLPWDIVMYQIQPWKTDGDVLTYAHAYPSEEPRSKSNHTSGETGKLSTRSGLPYLAPQVVLGQALSTLLGDGATALACSSMRNAKPWVMRSRGTYDFDTLIWPHSIL